MIAGLIDPGRIQTTERVGSSARLILDNDAIIVADPVS